MRYLLLLALLPIQAVAGPISKFDDKKPDIEQLSNVPLFDIERCLTDMDGWPVPFIYRQPDRPEETNMIWLHPSYGTALARAHLKKVDNGVAVRIWNADGKQAQSCVNKGTPR